MQIEANRVEDGSKWVRGFLGGHPVVDTRRTKLVWEVPWYPAYWFPEGDVNLERVSSSALRRRPEEPELAGYVHVSWEAMDAWFEEDEEIYVHPRNPYARVDILASSRHVEVLVNGTVVADSHQPRLLFETGLPVRYYLPATDVRMDLLRPSDTTSQCPYKGFASYWSVEVDGQVVPDLAWTYRTPLPESVKIAGLVCFYNEKVDLVVDGVPQERPVTHFV